MNRITSSLTGLASSLFMNAGLSQVAQKLDPVSRQRTELCSAAHGAAQSTFCNFPANKRT